MAAKLKDEKLPYEILIRFGIDGKVQGAHCQYRRRVMLGDELLKDEVGEAMPLALDDFPTSELMTAATRSALAELTDLNEKMAALTRENAGLRDMNEKLRRSAAEHGLPVNV
jgi:hypothetical protein